MQITIKDPARINTSLRVAGTQKPKDVIRVTYAMGDTIVDVTDNLTYSVDSSGFIIASAPNEFINTVLDFTLKHKPYFIKGETENDVDYLNRLVRGYYEFTTQEPKLVLSPYDVRIGSFLNIAHPSTLLPDIDSPTRRAFKEEMSGTMMYEVFRSILIEKTFSLERGRSVKWTTGEQHNSIYIFANDDIYDRLVFPDSLKSSLLGAGTRQIGGLKCFILVYNQRNFKAEVKYNG